MFGVHLLVEKKTVALISTLLPYPI